MRKPPAVPTVCLLSFLFFYLTIAKKIDKRKQRTISVFFRKQIRIFYGTDKSFLWKHKGKGVESSRKNQI